MATAQIPLPEVDEVRVTTVTNNSLDVLMASTEVAKRFPVRKDLFDHVFPVAEHGYSVLLDGMLLVSGEVARTTEFEKGMNVHHAKRAAHLLAEGRAKERLRKMIQLHEFWLGESERIRERWRTR